MTAKQIDGVITWAKIAIVTTLVGGLAYLGYLYVYEPIIAAVAPAQALASSTTPAKQVTDLTNFYEAAGIQKSEAQQVAEIVEQTEAQGAANVFGPLAPIITIPGNFLLNLIGL